MHKRSEERLQLRRIHRAIFSNCFCDKNSQEVVCQVSRVELLTILNEPMQLCLLPDVEKGEVLVDSRGEGSFQRARCKRN
jgi:hypothetical protein